MPVDDRRGVGSVPCPPSARRQWRARRVGSRAMSAHGSRVQAARSSGRGADGDTAGRPLTVGSSSACGRSAPIPHALQTIDPLASCDEPRIAQAPRHLPDAAERPVGERSIGGLHQTGALGCFESHLCPGRSRRPLARRHLARLRVELRTAAGRRFRRSPMVGERLIRASPEVFSGERAVPSWPFSRAAPVRSGAVIAAEATSVGGEGWETALGLRPRSGRVSDHRGPPPETGRPSASGCPASSTPNAVVRRVILCAGLPRIQRRRGESSRSRSFGDPADHFDRELPRFRPDVAARPCPGTSRPPPRRRRSCDRRRERFRPAPPRHSGAGRRRRHG